MGELIFPSRPEDEVVVFMLHTPTEARYDRRPALRVVNRLTLRPPTARPTSSATSRTVASRPSTSSSQRR